MKPGADSSELDLALERAWRAHSREAPPPELDRAILAAAHRAAGSGPQDALKAVAEATRPQRWWMPLAAAATIGVIAIGILQLTPREDNLVAPDERVAAVVRHGAQEQAPAPAVSQSVDDAVKERDAVPTGTRSETSDFRQKKKQEAKPAAAVPVPAPSAPPAPPVERGNKVATAKPAARAAEPQSLPVATESGKYPSAEMKQRDDLSGGTASSAANVITQAPATAAPATTVEERAPVRKEVVDERQRLPQAMDKAAASAQSGRPAQPAEGTVSSFASAPPPAGSPLAPARPGRDGGLAGNEAIGQAAPAAPPSPELARKAASLDDLRVQARDPDAWIVRIRKLRDAGDTAEALRELREFRNLVPDAERRLPADLLAWANTFKP